MRPDYTIAAADLIDGIRSYRIWTRLGWQEVKRRYRRTVFGPFWATLSIGAFIVGMVFIWAPLFKTDVKSYLPFLAAGLVSWTFATALISEGCTTYTAGVNLITQLNFPYTVLNFMVVWRNIIVFFHNILIVIVVVIALKIPVDWQTLLLIPGLIIVAVNGAWMTILFGMVSARFRDVPPLVGQKPFSDVYALHGCSSAGLLSANASRSLPRRMWLLTVFNGKPMVSAMSSYLRSSK